MARHTGDIVFPFKGIWITRRDLRMLGDMTADELLLLTLIDQLPAGDDECMSTNAELGDMLGMTKRRVANLIKKLHERALITIVYMTGGEDKVIRCLRKTDYHG